MASKKIVKSGFSELRERVPPKQMPKFMAFLEKNAKYKERVAKLPDQLPKIDWEYYRINVRDEVKPMIDDFEKKYEELNKIFDERVNIDQSKYYEELEQQRAEVMKDLSEYIEESNKQIEEYKAHLKHVKALKPYEQMTCEEFVELAPEAAKLYPSHGKNLFWPFSPEEQGSGPVGATYAPSSEANGKQAEAQNIKASKMVLIEEGKKDATVAELAGAQPEKSEEHPKKLEPKNEDSNKEIPKKEDPKGKKE